MAKQPDAELQGLIAQALELVEYLESIKGAERATALAAVKMIRGDLAMKDWNPKDRDSVLKKAALRHTMGVQGIRALSWSAQVAFHIETMAGE